MRFSPGTSIALKKLVSTILRGRFKIGEDIFGRNIALNDVRLTADKPAAWRKNVYITFYGILYGLLAAIRKDALGIERASPKCQISAELSLEFSASIPGSVYCTGFSPSTPISIKSGISPRIAPSLWKSMLIPGNADFIEEKSLACRGLTRRRYRSGDIRVLLFWSPRSSPIRTILIAGRRPRAEIHQSICMSSCLSMRYSALFSSEIKSIKKSV